MRLALLSILALACAPAAPPPAPPPAPAAAPAPPEPAAWAPPKLEDAPQGPLGDAIRRGHTLFTKTNELLPEHVPSNMNCQSCHLVGGTQAGAAPITGAPARFPKYMDRTGAVIALQDRVNYCFTRSLAGSRIPADSQEMTDLMAYITYVSTGVPIGTHLPGEGMPELARLDGDAARGEALYTEKGCVACHQADGGGVPNAFPALWGPRSYSIGASMAREERAATFIRQFMPQTAPGSLSPQEAFDLSAFINSHPRPDSPEKEKDWPSGGTPYDVPYDTSDHKAFKPPPVLARAKPESAVVPPPPPLRSAP